MTTNSKKKFVLYNTDENQEPSAQSQFKRDLRSDAGNVIRASLRKRKLKRGNTQISISQTTAHVNGRLSRECGASAEVCECDCLVLRATF